MMQHPGYTERPEISNQKNTRTQGVSTGNVTLPSTDGLSSNVLCILFSLKQKTDNKGYNGYNIAYDHSDLTYYSKAGYRSVEN